MNKTAKIELAVVGVVLVIFGLGLLPALQYARREYRDGIRRDELSQFKTALEQINNEVGSYPLEFDPSPHQYVVTKKEGPSAIEWYLRAELENPQASHPGFDFEGDRNYYYRIVNEQNKTFYDVCGGESRCGTPESL